MVVNDIKIFLKKKKIKGIRMDVSAIRTLGKSKTKAS